MVIGFALLAALQAAQPADGRIPDSAVVVTPGAKYAGGWLHRFVLGSAWRELWKAEIRVPVANLDTLRGGLTAVERGGHAQTLSLRFGTADGKTYNFRSVNKNPTQGFSGILRSPVTRWFATEQISAMFPAASLVVSDLEHAAGLIPTERWITVLPDSPRLGKWRDEFKGLLGIFEPRYPEGSEELPELPGAVELISSDTLFPRLRAKGGNQVDQPRYLTARLLDLVVGDWDRHAGQWSWVGVDREGLRWWVPLPRDRDWALSRFDGIGYDLVRFVKPSWTEFGPRYGRILGLTKSAQALDRRLLTGLDHGAWHAAVRELQERLTDAVITRAVQNLPAEFDRGVLDDVARSLRLRRDDLAQFADQYYRQLAEVVDVGTSDDAELAELTRDADGGVLLEILGRDRVSTFRRRFVPGETSEIRLHLYGGADTVRVRGNPRGIPVRVVTGGGADIVEDSTGGGALHVYDDSASARVVATGSVSHSTRRFEPPVPPEDPKRLERDWGRRLGIAPWFAVRPEIGVILGAGPVLYTYGFRKVPYQSKVAIRFGSTSKTGELNVDFKGDFRFERPDRRVLLRAALLNADVIRYFGLGNETTRSATIAFHNVTQRHYSFEPVVALGIGGPGRFELGGLLRWSETDNRETLLSHDDPYGSGAFTEAGLVAGLVYDSRNNEDIPTSGVTLELAGRVFPTALDVESTFGSVSLVGTAYLTAAALPTKPTLALRGAAKRMFGTYPFFEAADIGGRESFRGLTTRRFTGDAAVYGNSEVRLRLAGSWGLLGLVDIGRVYLDGEKSNLWHFGAGGGIWISTSGHLVTATVASGGEPLRFYVHTGFHF
jgi:hypothetical protein